MRNPWPWGCQWAAHSHVPGTHAAAVSAVLAAGGFMRVDREMRALQVGQAALAPVATGMAFRNLQRMVHTLFSSAFRSPASQADS